MAEIALIGGRVAIVDDETLPHLLGHTWRHADGYAVRGDGRRVVRMHRWILAAKPGEIVDHKNGNRLDNRRQNLRIVTAAENARNDKARIDRVVSAHKGVTWDRRFGIWKAAIKVDGRHFYVTGARSEEEAARLYDALARELHGEFACVNFPRDGERGALEAG